MKNLLKKKCPNLYDKLSKFMGDIRYYKVSKSSPQKYEKITVKQYKKSTGKSLDFNNLKTYSEKLQYYKLHKASKLKGMLADKFLAREWARRKIGDKYIIPLLGVWDKVSEIDFNELPEKFVLKTNHGSGGNIIIDGQNAMDINEIDRKFIKWLSKDFAFVSGIQPHYSYIDRKIIAEEYIPSEDQYLKDYRVFCFHGEPKFIIVDSGTHKFHDRDVYDLDWNPLPWQLGNFPKSKNGQKKPEKLEEIIALAEKLCKGFSQVRIDFYYEFNKIYFGEMTFTPSSGFQQITPEKYDFEVGSLWDVYADENTEIE